MGTPTGRAPRTQGRSVVVPWLLGPTLLPWPGTEVSSSRPRSVRERRTLWWGAGGLDHTRDVQSSLERFLILKFHVKLHNLLVRIKHRIYYSPPNNHMTVILQFTQMWGFLKGSQDQRGSKPLHPLARNPALERLKASPKVPASRSGFPTSLLFPVASSHF